MIDSTTIDGVDQDRKDRTARSGRPRSSPRASSSARQYGGSPPDAADATPRRAAGHPTSVEPPTADRRPVASGGRAAASERLQVATISTMSSPASVGLAPTFTPGVDERLHLGGGRALAARDDGAGVAHLLAGRGGRPGDVGRRPAWSSCAAMNSAASSSAEPPISPIIMTALVSGSASKRSRQSMKLVPGTGSPPMPTHVVTPMPCELQLVERLVGERAGAAHDADAGRPGLGDVAGGDADVALAGADDARAVRAEQLHVREVALELVEEPRLVLGRHALGDAHDELDATLGRLHDRGLARRGPG